MSLIRLWVPFNLFCTLALMLLCVPLAFADPASDAGSNWYQYPIDSAPVYTVNQAFFIGGSPGVSGVLRDGPGFDASVTVFQENLSVKGATEIRNIPDIPIWLSLTTIDSVLGTCSSLRQTYELQYRGFTECWYDGSLPKYHDYDYNCTTTDTFAVVDSGLDTTKLCDFGDQPIPDGWVPHMDSWSCSGPYPSGCGGGNWYTWPDGSMTKRVLCTTGTGRGSDGYDYAVITTYDVTEVTACAAHHTAEPFPPDPNPPSDGANIVEVKKILGINTSLVPLPDPVFDAIVLPPPSGGGRYDPTRDGCLAEVWALFSDRLSGTVLFSLPAVPPAPVTTGEFDFLGNHWSLESMKLYDFSLVTTPIWSVIGIMIFLRPSGRRAGRRSSL